MNKQLTKERKIAVILPIYNEEHAIYEHFKEITRVLNADGLSCEYMIVDDGSNDATWQEVEKICNEFPKTSAIKFSRNFGKETALRAGVDSIDADLYVTMDSDLQHPPEHVAPMIRKLEEEHVAIVNGVKSHRGKESLIHKFFAKSFYRLLHATAGLDFDNTSDFKVMRRDVIDQIRQIKERDLFFRGIVDWVGFPSVQYSFEVHERKHGTRSFSFRKLMSLAFSAIMSFTSKPLHMVTVSGGIFFLFAVILGVQTLINFFSGKSVSGFSTVILLLLIIGSLLMMSLGLIGGYIAKIYQEVKARPPYILEKKLSVPTAQKHSKEKN